jgi:hypothetical protein
VNSGRATSRAWNPKVRLELLSLRPAPQAAVLRKAAEVYTTYHKSRSVAKRLMDTVVHIAVDRSSVREIVSPSSRAAEIGVREECHKDPPSERMSPFAQCSFGQRARTPDGAAHLHGRTRCDQIGRATTRGALPWRG